MAAKLVKRYGREEANVITDANAPGRSCGHVVADLFNLGNRTCYVLRWQAVSSGVVVRQQL